MHTEVITMTPTMAKELLAANAVNRPARAAKIAAYARDMKAGAWLLTGETIIIDDRGRLVNGQHRLLACIQANVTFPVNVAHGAHPSAQEVMDTGVKRTAGDALNLLGYSNAILLAAITRLALRYRITGGGAKRLTNLQPTTTEIVQYVEKHPRLCDAATVGARYQTQIDAPASVVGLVWWLTAHVDQSGANEYLDSLANFRTSGHNDPRGAVLKRLAAMSRERTRGRSVMDQSVYLAVLLRGWNAWRRGEHIANIPATIQIPRKVL